MPEIPYNPPPSLPDKRDPSENSTYPPQPKAKPDVTDLKAQLRAIGIVVRPGLIQSYNFVAGTAGWQLTSAGVITALSGAIGGWTIDATSIYSGGASQNAAKILIDSANSLIRVGVSTGEYISIDGVNQRIRSSNYNAGVSGFTIQPDLIEAQNIVARGILKGTTFQCDIISAVGGQLLISNADTLDADMTALDASTLTTKGTTSWAVNDMLLIQAITALGVQTEYLRITDISSAPIYTVTRDLETSYTSNINPIWQKGTTISKIGSSDGAASYSGGWLRLLGEGTNAPHYSVFSRTGVAYNGYTEIIRLGNLNGIGGNVSDTYGIFMGDYSAGQYAMYDSASGNFVINGRVPGALSQWIEVTDASATGEVSTGYVTNRSSVVNIALPTSAQLGDIVKVVWKGSGGWNLHANSTNGIFLQGTSGDDLASNATGATATVVCVTESATTPIWRVTEYIDVSLS